MENNSFSVNSPEKMFHFINENYGEKDDGTLVSKKPINLIIRQEKHSVIKITIPNGKISRLLCSVGLLIKENNTGQTLHVWIDYPDSGGNKNKINLLDPRLIFTLETFKEKEAYCKIFEELNNPLKLDIDSLSKIIVMINQASTFG